MTGSIHGKFEQFQQFREIFGFLFDIKKLKWLDDDNFKKYCLNLEFVLKHDSCLDIDSLDLFWVKNLKKD